MHQNLTNLQGILIAFICLDWQRALSYFIFSFFRNFIPKEFSDLEILSTQQEPGNHKTTY